VLKQDIVFDATSKPFIDYVLRGYSCFLFVCGQHGSGKTELVFGNEEVRPVRSKSSKNRRDKDSRELESTYLLIVTCNVCNS
jgi:hypothetical protein